MIKMGLFDGWRRKRKREATVKLQEPKMSKSVESKVSEDIKESEQVDTVSLVAEYERLIQRKEILQVERGELTAKLDRGEIEPDDFRKELMNRIQEAAEVSEKLRVTAVKLTSLGYRGVLH